MKDKTISKVTIYKEGWFSYRLRYPNGGEELYYGFYVPKVRDSEGYHFGCGYLSPYSVKVTLHYKKAIERIKL
jgi:hypothetical protein